MKRHGKKHLAMLLAAMLTFAAVWQWMPVGVREVRAEELIAEESIEVNNGDALRSAFDKANEGQPVTVRLTGDIVLAQNDLTSGAKFQLTSENNLTLDLNGCCISASHFTSTNPIFSCDGGTLTINDSSSCGGYIQGPQNGVCVQATRGTLNISGGTFSNAAQCLSVKNTEVNISGNPSLVTDGNGTTDCALMVTGDNTTVNISGGSFKSSYDTIWVKDTVTDESSLNIEGGTFTANDKNGSANVCSVDGRCNVKISGGTFNLNSASGSARKGSALVLGKNVTDDMVNISGGTFHGRIARAISDTAQANYEVFYGNGTSGGIIDEGHVLTDNTFYQNSEGDKRYFTQDEVEVVPGSLVTFNTRRSLIETYSTDESTLKCNADYYSMDPISVTEDGKNVYANTKGLVSPVVETGRISDGNTYTFSCWYNEEGTAYATLQDFIDTGKMAGAGQRVTLSAGWKAQTGDENGLRSALVNRTVVSEIELVKDIALSASIDEFASLRNNRILNLSGHTVSSTADTTALVLSSPWTIMNGTINSSNQPCLEIGGTVTIENLNCLSENASYVVKFVNVSSANRIISGTFETTGTGGHALCVTNATTKDITNLFGGSYASSTGTVKDNNGNIYISASRLIVSQSPITYIGNAADLNLGSHVYGESVPASTQLIGNEEYVGDIVITGVSVDNPVFTVTGEGKPKYLRGGVSQDKSSYSYTVGVAENTDAGSYTGTVTVSYTKMDGSDETYTRKLALTITPKQLTITDPTVIREKVYDGTTTAQVTAGALEGVVAGDEVTVSATAAYDSADVGTGKKITVKYTLAGADCGNYLAPADTEITDGSVAAPKKDTQLTDSKTKMIYKVTKSGATGGTVQFAKTSNTKAKTVAIPATVTIDGITYKVTSIAANALKNNKVVTTVTIGKNVTAIGSGAFSGCTKLKKVTIGKSVTNIGASAFSGCTKLTSVTIGSNVTTISDKAFYKCTSLAKITIPSKVKKIGKQAFYGCKKLKTITIKTTKLTSKNVGSKAFTGIYAKATIKVPKSKLKTYKTLFVKKGLSKKVTIKNL